MPSVVLLQRDHEASPRLRALIDATDEFHVSAELHTVEQARACLRQGLRPDILVTDMRVQDGDAHPFLAELKPRGAASPHVLVTMLSHDDALLMDALGSGADGYWIHTQSDQGFIESLRQLWRGESPISPTIARQVLSHFREPPQGRETGAPAAAPSSWVLTQPEREILHRVAQGYLIDEIAQQWHSSVHLVACGIRCVYRKLQTDLQTSGPALHTA